MKFPGMILMGAQSRLLPPSIPFRFFVSALAFHVLAWMFLALDAGQVPAFVGGPGWVLGGIHALTLGVLTMTAIGASLQILPVVTGQSLIALWPCRLTFWLYVPGVAGLIFGLVTGDVPAMTWGGGLAVAGLVIFAILVADVLRRTKGLLTLVLHGWASLFFLAVMGGLGLMLAFDFDSGFLADHSAVALVHWVIAAYGFMGMLVFGYSQFMVPMFALGPSPDERPVIVTFGLAVGAIVLAAAAALGDSPLGLMVAAAIGFVAVVLHVGSMRAVMVRGMRKRLGLSFVLVRTAWAMLAAGPMLAVIAFAAGGEDRLATLIGFFTLFGWLLTFLMGILQRIIPFLAAMNAAKAGQTPPTLSDVSVETPLKVHAIGHFGGLILISSAIVADSAALALAGAVAGSVGGLAFLWFAIDTLRRMRGYATRAAGPKQGA